MKWYAASDHAGLSLKDELVAFLREMGDDVEDLGTNNSESVDYPEYGQRTALRVVEEGPDVLGLLVCGTGNGIAMAANKVHGARAALVTDSFTAKMARAHNNANLIVFGARVTGGGVAVEALAAFRGASFEGGRHARRVELLAAIEDQTKSGGG